MCALKAAIVSSMCIASCIVRYSPCSSRTALQRESRCSTCSTSLPGTRIVSPMPLATGAMVTIGMLDAHTCQSLDVF